MPLALQNRPVVEEKLLYFRSVFMQLSDSRTFSQSGQPLPIPLSEYVAYCELFGISRLQERERLFKMVRAQDRVYVTHTAAKITKQLAEEAEEANKTKGAVAPR